MEAVTSSRIEGTKANFQDLFTTKASVEFTNDVTEVKNCANAFRAGPKILSSAKSVMDLAKGLHRLLLEQHQTIKGGELKKAQNYIMGFILVIIFQLIK
jgi:hypothetical protein